MIRLQGISKFFGQSKAVNQISFTVAEGETLVLLGKSGCGKTTTLRMLNRLTEPDEGLIELNGKDISREDPDQLRRGIGYVLQHHGLFPHYTVAENIAIVPRLLKWEKERINQRSAELLDKLKMPLSKFKDCYPTQLSGGQQQRVGLARALMVSPSVLLMDEPFGALDPLTRASIRKEFNELDELKSKTIVMVTHDILEAFEMADRICLMDQGRIVQVGTPYQLLFEPKNEFVKSFFQDQRLQLELKALRIVDVWKYIPEQTDGAKASNSLSKETSLWDVLAALLQSENNRIHIQGHGAENKVSGYKELMTAYSEFKTRHHE